MTITLTSKEISVVIETRPLFLVSQTEDRAFRDFFEPTLPEEDREEIEDRVDLALARELYDRSGVEAFIPFEAAPQPKPRRKR